tara:strand:- start:856 stop:1644 length:789 start_codon:yes stop_codon:yes gene_type:complete
VADEATNSETEKSAADHDQAVDNDERPFLSHLLELRGRILKSLIVVFLLFIPTFYFNTLIFEFIASPLLAHLPEGGTMIATDVASPFLTPFKLAILAAIFLAMPVILHQAWGFIAPGLYLREKHFATPLLVSSIALFYLGTAFAYYLVFPLVFGFFASVNMEFVTWMTDISPYLDFIVKMFLAFGLAFEIPIATVLLVMTGFASPEAMAKKRAYVLVGCFFIGMLLTPPDVISQVLLAIPMWALFELGIFLSRFVTRGREES